MSRPPNPLFLHTVLGLGLLAVFLFLVAPAAAWWQKVLGGIFCIGLGYQLAAAIKLTQIGGSPNVAVRTWLGALVFVVVIFAVLNMPQLWAFALAAVTIIINVTFILPRRQR